MIDRKKLDLAIAEAREYIGIPDPPKGIEARATDSLKLATIDLIRGDLNPDNILLGSVLTNIKKIATVDTPITNTLVIDTELCMKFNPNWIAYLNDLLGGLAVQKLVKHEAMHLLLGHSAALDFYSEGKDKCAASISMDICINTYLEREVGCPPSLCPACLVAALKKDERDIPIPDKIRGYIKTIQVTNPSCDICYGTGCIELTVSTVNTFLQREGAPKIRLPGNFDVAAHRPVFREIMALPDSLFEHSEEQGRDKNMHGLSEVGGQNSGLGEDGAFQEALINTIVHHSVAQAKASKAFADSIGSGGLLDSFRKLSVKKEVPYITRVRGTLGSSMRDETTPTRYRPNRRFGYTYPGSKSVPKQRYVFAIDTSGSLDREELKKVISEFVNIRRCSDKIECRILFFHHNVYFDKELSEYTDADLDKIESGGTNFDAVLKAVYEGDKREKDRAVLMINTDGYCSINYPRSKVRGRVIWLLTPGGTSSYAKSWHPNADIITMNASGKGDQE